MTLAVFAAVFLSVAGNAASALETNRKLRARKNADSAALEQPQYPATPCVYGVNYTYTGSMDPCTPDFSSISPAKPVTADDVRQANLKAFIDEIAKDEYSKIQQAAFQKAKVIAEEERKRLEAEKAQQDVHIRAQIDRENAQKEVVAKLANATATMMEEVAVKAAEAGRREQLARDQQVVAELLRRQYEASNVVTQEAWAGAQEDRMRASAAQAAAMEAMKASLSAAATAETKRAQARAAQEDTQAAYSEVNSKTEAAAHAAAQHVSDTEAAISSVKAQAKMAVDDMASVEELLVAGQSAPSASSSSLYKE